MLATILSASVVGVDACPISVEVDIAAGLPVFTTVGLPDAAVKESRERVTAALRNSGFDVPNRRITVSLAPADLKKEGTSFDLPIAVGILAAAGAVAKEPLDGVYLVGELALDGTLRPVRGALPVALGLQQRGVGRIVVPEANAAEASIVSGITVYPAKNLAQVVRFFNGEETIEPCRSGAGTAAEERYELDFSEVKGQQFAKRALEIAAAGMHNVLMIGAPGSGKTMLAKRLPTILPPLTVPEAIETAKIHSVAGILPPRRGLPLQRPFRAPHHTVSDIALVGGGSFPRPGEVSLAHNGILFLDEMTEFHRDVLEVLRQPLEDRSVTVARARHTVSFPAAFMLVAAMNPCPCGALGHPEKECRCTPYQVMKYRARLSGPLLDRIDLHLEVPPLKTAELTGEHEAGEPSAAVRERVLRARAVQTERFAGTGVHCNSQMQSRHLKNFCVLDDAAGNLLRGAIERLSLSGRAYDRILKVSRTIADLDGSRAITVRHVAEAVQYRSLDRN